MKAAVKPIALIAALAAAPAFLAFQVRKGESKGMMEKVPAYYQTEAEAKPFPKTLPPEQFDHPAIRRAYEAARRIPGVLAQQPCYCYCERMGHKGLQHCHRDTHSAS